MGILEEDLGAQGLCTFLNTFISDYLSCHVNWVQDSWSS